MMESASRTSVATLATLAAVLACRSPRELPPDAVVARASSAELVTGDLRFTASVERVATPGQLRFRVSVAQCDALGRWTRLAEPRIVCSGPADCASLEDDGSGVLVEVLPPERCEGGVARVTVRVLEDGRPVAQPLFLLAVPDA